MPLRFLFKYLANNERLVQRIADSYPVRKVARLCLSLFYRTQESLPPPDKINSRWIRSFLDNFKKNLSDGFKDVSKSIKENETKKR